MTYVKKQKQKTAAMQIKIKGIAKTVTFYNWYLN
jgi:hypothetical protein